MLLNEDMKFKIASAVANIYLTIIKYIDGMCLWVGTSKDILFTKFINTRPLDFIGSDDEEFMNLLEAMKPRLEITHQNVDRHLEIICFEYHGLKKKLNPIFGDKDMISALEKAKFGTFQEAWFPVFKDFPNLGCYCFGLETIFGTTAQVEGGFSEMNAIVTKTRVGQLDAVTDGYMQAKQFRALAKIIGFGSINESLFSSNIA